MKMKFLCANHRQQLSQSPKAALRCCQHGLETGLYMKRIGIYEEAIPHLGCAFETAELLLSGETMKQSEAADLFANIACTLAETYRMLRFEAHSSEIFMMAIGRLKQLASTQALYSPALNKLQHHMRSQQTIGSETHNQSVLYH